MHVKLAGPQAKRLEKLSSETGMTVSEHIRRAIDAYFRALDLVKARQK